MSNSITASTTQQVHDLRNVAKIHDNAKVSSIEAAFKAASGSRSLGNQFDNMDKRDYLVAYCEDGTTVMQCPERHDRGYVMYSAPSVGVTATDLAPVSLPDNWVRIEWHRWYHTSDFSKMGRAVVARRNTGDYAGTATVFPPRFDGEFPRD